MTMVKRDGWAAVAVMLAASLAGQQVAEIAGEVPASQPAAASGVPTSRPVVAVEKAASAPRAAETLPAGRVAVLTVAAVRNVKGNGPDGKGNTNDDTWGFWFELAHAKGTYKRLDLATQTMPAAQRAGGIVDPKSAKGHQGKVRGPVASMVPNPKDTEGWIFHTDWDGRFEGVWGDTKDNQVVMHPYVEKNAHGAVAVTYKAPATGTYRVSGSLTDLQVRPKFEKNDGVTGILEVADGGGKGREIARFGPFGDGHGRPDSVEMKAGPFDVKAGQLIRLVVHPNKWWGSDMTKVELRIERPAK